MVYVYCNSNRHEYDIRALVMAFYPNKMVEYVISDEISEGKSDVAGDICIYITLNDKDMKVSLSNVSEDVVFGEVPEPKEYRDNLKRLVYRVLSLVTGKSFAWGTLTGVRPAKIPMKYLLNGYSTDETAQIMKEEYYCSDEKIKLCTDVAKAEISILDKVGFDKGYSIYIGIPFCPTVCTYCSFSSISLMKLKNPEEMMENYIGALEKECQFARDIFPDKKLTSIYVGGGTPTALSEKYLKRLMDIIRENFPVSSVYEFTVEAGRPDSINEEKLRIMKEAGVTRISVNPQSMKDETLVKIGRNHTVEQTVEVFKLARQMGFDNINMDLIAGLYDETVEDFRYTLDKLDELGPDSFTVHSLVVKRASEYRQQKEQEKKEHVNSGVTDNVSDRDMAHASENVVECMLSMASEYAAEHNYFPYYMYRQKNKAGLGENPVLENIGYSKQDKEGIYNVLIMEEKQTIIALGAGASSKLVYAEDDNSLADNEYRITRIANVKNVNEYIARIDEMIERKKRWLIDG